MKRLIVCCDGTWQSHNNKIPTNVLKIAQAIKPMDEDGISQILYYDQGIGAVPDYELKMDEEKRPSFLKSIVDLLQKIGGGAFGWWIDEKIEEAYIFLCLNYEPGDEIYLFGFSRGAYTVRSLAGLISCCGLLKRPHISKTSAAYEIYRHNDRNKRKNRGDLFRQERKFTQPEPVRIKFLGCWDTVGALGIPDLFPFVSIDKISGRKYTFHNEELSSIIENARHAIAIDEKRSTFKVTMMESAEGFEGTLEQVCFPGDHGCVGGGTDEMIKLSDDCELNTLDLSKAALNWMAKQASDLGLDLDLNLAQNNNHFQSNSSTTDKNFLIKMIGRLVKMIRSVVKTGIKERDLDRFYNLDKDFHHSIRKHWCDNQKYRPKNLPESIEEQLKNYCQSAQK